MGTGKSDSLVKLIISYTQDAGQQISLSSGNYTQINPSNWDLHEIDRYNVLLTMGIELNYPRDVKVIYKMRCESTWYLVGTVRQIQEVLQH